MLISCLSTLKLLMLNLIVVKEKWGKLVIWDNLRCREDAVIDPISRADDDATHGYGSLTPENREEDHESVIANASDTFSFGDLCPVESTNRLRASQIFYRLLLAEKQGEAISTQGGTYGPIRYSKKK